MEHVELATQPQAALVARRDLSPEGRAELDLTQSREGTYTPVLMQTENQEWIMERAQLANEPAEILLVDDRPESLLTLRASLEDEQYHLVTATSGPEALLQLLEKDFAVIVLDIQMPGMDGFEIAELIRQRERSQYTPILFLTAAYQSEADVLRAYTVGAVDYIVKPVVPQILRGKVAALVDLYRLQLALQRQLGVTRQLNQALGASNRALAQSESRLRELNTTLEQRVLERTEALQKAEAKYRSIFENVTEGIWQLSPTGSLLTANPGLARILGYDSSDALIAAINNQDTKDTLGTSDRVAFRQQLAEQGQLQGFELQITRPDGGLRWILINAHSICAAGGQLLYYEGTVEDVTERKQTVEALRFLTQAGAVLAASLDYEKTLESIAELAVPGLADWCTLDLLEDDTLQRFAARHIDPDKTALARELSGRYPPDPGAPYGKSKVIRTGEPELHSEISEEQLATAARDPGHLELLCTLGLKSAMFIPLTARGKILGALSLYISTPGRRYAQTDLALAEEFARRAAVAIDNGRLYNESQIAVRARDHFLAVASHELKTPLTVISGYTDLLSRRVEASVRRTRENGDLGKIITVESEPLLRQIGNLQQASARLTGLVNEMLDVNRLQTGALDLTMENFNLATLFSGVVENFVMREQARPRGIELRARCETDEIWGWWDRGRLEQVLVNLIDNAIKYSRSQEFAEANLSVQQTEQGEKQAHLYVRDYGIGIPVEEQNRIFKPFIRATNASAQHFPGLGLGLAISQQIVERHNGRIWVESDGLNQGSTFHVVLPLNGPQNHANGEQA